jgi:hypothetical protein
MISPMPVRAGRSPGLHRHSVEPASGPLLTAPGYLTHEKWSIHAMNHAALLTHSPHLPECPWEDARYISCRNYRHRADSSDESPRGFWILPAAASNVVARVHSTDACQLSAISR